MFIDAIWLILSIVGIYVSNIFIVRFLKRVARHNDNKNLRNVIYYVSISIPELFILGYCIKQLTISRKEFAIFAMSTIVGSSIVQLTIFMGILALFFTIGSKKLYLEKDFIYIIISIVVFWLLGLDKGLGIVDGVILLGAFTLYMVKHAKSEDTITAFIHVDKKHHLKDFLSFCIAVLIMLFSAKFFLESLNKLLFTTGFPIDTIGLIIIGIVVVLPKFKTYFKMFLKNKDNKRLPVGFILSGIFTNLLFITGIGALLSNISIIKAFFWYDIPFMLIITLLIFFFLKQQDKLENKEGFILIAIYIVYLMTRFKIF